MRDILAENPHVSCKRNGSGLPPATFNRIVRFDLNFHPYIINKRHELKDADFNRRINFSRWLIQKFGENDFLRQIVIGDEASFSLNGHVASRNVRMYSEKGNPPNFNFDVPCSREKVTVWAALCGNGRI